MIKIITTIGPSSWKPEVIKSIDKNGADYLRINLSHTPISELEKKIQLLKKNTQKEVCIDTEGAQVRTANIKKSFSIKNNEIIKIYSLNSNFNKNKIYLNVNNFQNKFRINDILYIDFDGICLQVLAVNKFYLETLVIKGGEVINNKGVSFNRSININAFSQKDLKAFKIAIKNKIKTIFLSFASSKNDILNLRSFFPYTINIFSKVESRIAIKNLKEICKFSDAILIDRGDLSRDVQIEKIPLIQKKIIQVARSLKTKVFVATNLMDSMIKNSLPNRAEMTDISNAIDQKVSGLVLAAETAIGKNPSECVKILKNIILLKQKKKVNFFINEYPNQIIPHGGTLINNYKKINKNLIKKILPLQLSENAISECLQIAHGVYSPVEKFMNRHEILKVINKEMHNKIYWPMPIFLQIKKNFSMKLKKGLYKIIDNKKKLRCFLFIEKIQKLNLKKKYLFKLFNTNDSNHPGIKKIINDGDYIIIGKPFYNKDCIYSESPQVLPPIQTRRILYEKGGLNTVGFHTRNLPHNGHLYIQTRAINKISASNLFISPLVQKVKNEDASFKDICLSYKKIIKKNFYKCNIFVNGFLTYPRFAGPREAIFTALCRQNYGCTHFIIGRDHSGVGNYYKNINLKKFMSTIEKKINIKLIFFNEIFYSQTKKKLIESNKKNQSMIEISGTKARFFLKRNKKLPNYIYQIKKIKT